MQLHDKAIVTDAGKTSKTLMLKQGNLVLAPSTIVIVEGLLGARELNGRTGKVDLRQRPIHCAWTGRRAPSESSQLIADRA